MKKTRRKSITRRPRRAAAPSSRAVAALAPAAFASIAPTTATPLDAMWDRESDDVNVPGLNRPAMNAVERRRAFDHAVNVLWVNEDISAVRRVESGGRSLWVMWRRATLPPG